MTGILDANQFALQTTRMVTTPLPARTGFDPQRLDELQEITRQYGEYGRSRFGLWLTIFSVWLIAPAVAFMAGWPEVGRLQLATGAVVWFPVLQHARAGYQRHGAVILEEAPDGLVRLSSRWRGLRGFLLWGGLPSLVLVFTRSAWPDAFVLSHGVGYGLGVALVLMTVLGAWLFGRGYRDTTIPAFLLFAAMVSTFGTLGDPGIALGIALMAVLGVVQGLLQHRQFRQLERRLLALKGGA